MIGKLSDALSRKLTINKNHLRIVHVIFKVSNLNTYLLAKITEIFTCIKC